VSGLGLIDVIRSLQSHVNGIVIGAAYSMASCILQACDTRVVTPHSTLMVHWGSGDKNQLAKKLEPAFLQIYLDRIRERHPSYTYQKLDKLLYTDTYMSAREAIELGLADSTTIPVGGQ
jgi:ATP-dependent protease ClpP protease subunit